MPCSQASRRPSRIVAETSTGESTRPASCASQGKDFRGAVNSGFDSQDFAECTRRVGTIAPCSRAYAPT